MARGNDSAAAAAEFRGQYGIMGNAEDLIQANRSAYDADLRAASLKPIDTEATAELKDDDGTFSGLASKAGIDNGRILDAAVRGDAVVAVVETESGHTYKQVLDRDGSLPEGDGSTEQKVSEAQSTANIILLRAREEADKIIAEAVQKANEEASEKAVAARDEANSTIEKAAADDAEAQDEKSVDDAKSGDASGSEVEAAKSQQSARAKSRQ